MAREPITSGFRAAADATRRAVCVGAAALSLGLVGLAGANAQVKEAQAVLVVPPVVSIPSAAPPVSLVEKCDVIRNVFRNSAKLVKEETKIKPFTPGYQGRLDVFLDNNCRGNVPLPTERSDIQLFNTIAGILENGGNISLTP